MTDPLKTYQADWDRRKAISDRWGHGSMFAAAIAGFGYYSVAMAVPGRPDPTTGHIYRLLIIQHHVFGYATRDELIIALVCAAIAIPSFLAGLIVYYIYNPGALYRGSSKVFGGDK